MTKGKQEHAGLSVEEIIERAMGSALHRATILAELEGAASFAEEEFKHDRGEAAVALMRAAKDWQRLLARMSVTEDGALTFWRICGMCEGRAQGCEECNGKGRTRLQEDDTT